MAQQEMEIILSINNTEKGLKLIEEIKERNDNENFINKKIVLTAFKEEIVSQEPFIVKIIPRVRMNIYLLFANIDAKLKELNVIPDIDYKIELRE